MTPRAGSKPAAVPVQRLHILVRGLVQGVGFRPHVYRVASRHGIGGFVRNGPDGVVIEAEGTGLDSFLEEIHRSAPPLARIDTLVSTPLAALGQRDFSILESHRDGAGSAAVPADVALCDDCLRELFDPCDRRYLHPFIACSNCGPRFSMTRRLPYDRAGTSMSGFALCDPCDREYRDPASRRFHAEPVACNDCGPRLSHGVDVLCAALRAGRIVAVKGVGGFHLACDARNHDAVAELRRRKHRDGKPFAVMVLNNASAGAFVAVDGITRDLLESHRRPVVVLPRTSGSRVLGPDLSPGLDTLGVMLPYTPLHYLVFHTLLGRPVGRAWLRERNDLALVMTSANISGDPLITDDEEARERLGEVADLIVGHDRDIAARVDDSVLRVAGGEPLLIRRARGYVPDAIRLARAGPSVLAVGAHLKNTLTITRGDRAFVSQHIGDLESPATVAFQESVLESLCAMLHTKPELVACDWHRDYASSRLAERLSAETDVPLLRVQHHHAHVAAVLALHGHEGPALGIALDGHGLGAEGQSWGGELLRVDGAQFQRLGHFAPLAAPGGDAAAREPWRLAAGVLHALGRGGEITRRFPRQALAAPLARLLAGGDYPVTTAAGRLFDAAAGLLGVSERAAFEGEPPMRLEGLVSRLDPLPGGFSLQDGVLDFTGLLAALCDCSDPVTGAQWLHGTLVESLVAWAVDAAQQSGLEVVALAGGCFLNAHLAAEVPRRLRAAGLQPLTARDIPPSDGSISLGQAWVAQQSLLNSKTPLEAVR